MSKTKFFRNSPKKREKNYILTGILIGSLTIAVISGITFFVMKEHYYRSHFVKGTIINDIDVSQLTIDELNQKIQRYTLTVVERNAEGGMAEEKITGNNVGLELKSTNEIAKVLEKQKNGKWLFNQGESIEISDFVDYNEKTFKQYVKKLQCFSDDFVIEPKDAHISEYDEESNQYEIVPQVKGNQLYSKKAKNLLKDAFLQLDTKVDFEESDCYKKPLIGSEDKGLNQLLKNMNEFVSVEITYTFGDNKEIVDGDLIHNWLLVNEDNTVTLDTSYVKEYVATLRRQYDTIFRPRTFMTTYGKEVTLSKGDYGWWMNYGQEEKELAAMIEAGQSGERAPVYFQTAAQYKTPDYGDTYIEINLTAQHMYYYEKGKLVLESDFVSGNQAKGHETPDGVYGITYKQRNATLVGEGYKTPVSYWMPFNNHIGLHDATWRATFGSDIYQKSGSHGCVNLPYYIGKELYSRIEKGTPVICYNLKETKSEGVTKQGAEEIAASVIDRINEIGKITKDSEKLIERARTLYDKLNHEQKKLVTNYKNLISSEKEFAELKKK